MAQRSEPAGQTFLFADLSGFTALTEAHGVDVLRALAELPRTQREALALVAWADMTAEEAGRVLGIQPVSVRGRVHRAKATLRQRMGGPDG